MMTLQMHGGRVRSRAGALRRAAGIPLMLAVALLVTAGTSWADDAAGSPAPAGADWPTWRADGQRSGATAHSLPEGLLLQWSRRLPKPAAAYDYHFRLCADVSYEPVAAGGLLFVPSNVRDDVTAYDLATGAERWRFVCEGPVRFAPIASGDRVWFVSDDGHLYCLEAATGALRWKVRGAPADRADYRMLVNGRMCSRWPARGGPLLKDGLIYFGCGLWPSEGVFALAVDADTGKVVWRNSEISQIDDGLEEHGRMADLGLPPHGYFAAIGDRVAMPSGRAMAAFLDPQSGKLDPYNSYYAKVYPVPRGAWAVVGGDDFWWQGGAVFATNPNVLDALPAGPLTLAEMAKVCGQSVAWVEKQIAAGTLRARNLRGEQVVVIEPRSPAMAFVLESRHKRATEGQAYQLEHRPVVNMPSITTRHEIDARALPVFAGPLMIRSEHTEVMGNQIERGMTHVASPGYNRIRAYDLHQTAWSIEGTVNRGPATLRRQLNFKQAWQLDTPLVPKIVAGKRLYAAGENTIAAIAMPQKDEAPRVLWQAEVEGYPVGVIAAHERLIVTTNTGMLYCFGEAATAAPASLAEEEKPLPSTSEWDSFVRDLKPSLAMEGGYALVLGWSSGGLASALDRQTSLAIIVAEPDQAAAARARMELARAGVPAKRVQVVSGDSTTLRLPPYFAELVVSEDMTALDNGARLWTRIGIDALRPFAGVARLLLRPKLMEQARARAEELGGFEFEDQGRLTTIRRVGMPTGADEWTHEAANAGNTFASAERLAVPPFGLLWYSGGIDHDFSPAFEYHHNRNPYPTISQGRMFLLAASDVHAVDVWTGRHLWKVALPETDKTQRWLTDHRTYSRPTDQNLIATPDTVYVIRENEAVRLDAATGKLLGKITVEGGEPWDEARLTGDTLYVASGNRLLALDRRTGKLHWEHKVSDTNIAFAIDSARAYLVGYSAQRSRDPKPVEAARSTLVALRLSDGQPIWKAQVEAVERPEQSESSVGKPKWSGVFFENPLKPVVISGAAGVTLVILDRHRFYAFESGSGKQLWSYTGGARLTDLVGFEPPVVTNELVICDNGSVLDLRTGQPAGPKEIGGRGTGCNRFVGSDALVTFRSALACVLDFESGERTYLSSTRSGCTNGMLPAAGILSGPNTAHGCVCNYPFLASYAMFHLPDAARWAPADSPDVQVSNRPDAE
ncbi:MAG: PQQ-binding-like beta-propeller repeat protein [Planctomycetota bacterium]